MTLLKDTKEDVYNVPQPFFLYLSSIGSVVDKMGKRTFLNVPSLPVTAVGGKCGYHSAAVTEQTHCLFEELPSLGDMLMAGATAAEEPTPVFGFAFPPRAEARTTYSESSAQLASGDQR